MLVSLVVLAKTLLHRFNELYITISKKLLGQIQHYIAIIFLRYNLKRYHSVSTLDGEFCFITMQSILQLLLNLTLGATKRFIRRKTSRGWLRVFFQAMPFFIRFFEHC